tara:strand:- start:12511 stop:13194 length:684 start_codon:yes stop_codon:yes gene_type:complete
MGYGIEIVGVDGGGVFKVQDTDLNMINYQIIAQGVASSYTPSAGDKIFINGNYSGTQGHPICVQTGSGGVKNFQKVSFSGNAGQHLTNVSVTAANCNYIVLRKANVASNSGGNYGIQLFTSSGTVAFDSRRLTINDSFVMTESRAPRSVSGNNGQITTNGDAYLEVDALFSLVVPSGLVEASVSACTWNGSGTGTGRLRYLSFFASHENQSTDYFSNHNTMLLGQDR